MESTMRRIIPMMRICPHTIKDDHLIVNIKDRGMFCGYVAIPQECSHIIHKDADDLSTYQLPDTVEYSIHCHGGITYNTFADDLKKEPNFIPLIDCTNIDTKNYEILGFDFNHFGDSFEKCTPMYIQQKTIDYYNFIKKYISDRL